MLHYTFMHKSDIDKIQQILATYNYKFPRIFLETNQQASGTYILNILIQHKSE
jgi:hypothetical protein